MQAQFLSPRLRWSPPAVFIVVALTIPLLGATNLARSEGLTYDMRMQMAEEGEKAEEKTVMAAHAQYMAGNSRIEFTQSMAANGLMGAGTYVIVKAGSSKQYIVNPAKHEYSELDPDELAKVSSQLGGAAKVETSDIHFDTQSMGAGEAIQGYSTVKYRITQAYTTTMTIMGKTNRSTERSTTDMWIAPKLAGVLDPMADQMRKLAVQSPELGKRMAEAYAKLPKGLPLKTVTRSQSKDGVDKTASVMTAEISNIKQGPISKAVFEIPAGYKQTSMFQSMMGASPPDSQRGTKPAKTAASQPAADKKDNSDTNAVGDVMDAAKDGAKEGATEEAKSQAKEEAKKALRGLFGK